MGFSISESEIADGIKGMIEEQKASTAEAEESVKELDLDVLENVAGGKAEHAECMDTYKDKENCWYEDGCDMVFYGYKDYICKSHCD